MYFQQWNTQVSKVFLKSHRTITSVDRERKSNNWGKSLTADVNRDEKFYYFESL